MYQIIIIAAAIVLSGLALIIACINHKIARDSGHISMEATIANENRIALLEYERSTESQLAYLFSRILEDLYTTTDMRAVAWKLYQLKELGVFLKNYHGDTAATLRDVLIQRVILGPDDDALAVVEMMNDKLKAYYNLDTSVDRDWRLLLDYLISHREEGQQVSDIYKKSEAALRNRLVCLHFDCAILDTNPEHPGGKSGKELFDEALDRLAEEYNQLWHEKDLEDPAAESLITPDTTEDADDGKGDEGTPETPTEQDSPSEEAESTSGEIPVDISNLKRRPCGETPVTVY